MSSSYQDPERGEEGRGGRGGGRVGALQRPFVSSPQGAQQKRGLARLCYALVHVSPQVSFVHRGGRLRLLVAHQRWGSRRKGGLGPINPPKKPQQPPNTPQPPSGCSGVGLIWHGHLPSASGASVSDTKLHAPSPPANTTSENFQQKRRGEG